MGDSKVIVDWSFDVYSIHSVGLFHWLGRVKRLIGLFNNLSFQHIYKDFNSLVDDLSKQAIGIEEGSITWEELSDGVLIDSGYLSLQ